MHAVTTVVDYGSLNWFARSIKVAFDSTEGQRKVGSSRTDHPWMMMTSG